MRYRLTVVQRVVPFALAGCVISVGLEIVYRITDGRFFVAEGQDMLLATAAIAAANVFMFRSYGVELRGSELIVHNNNRCTIKSANVTSIDIESVMGIRTVVIHEVSGRRTRLRAPSSMLDRGFELKARRIEAWWRGVPSDSDSTAASV